MTMRYDCVLPSSDNTRVLLVRDGDRWALPSVVCRHAWVATAADQLCAEFRERYRLDVFILRILQWPENSVTCELEALGGEGNDDSQWVEPSDPIVNTLTAGETAALRSWSEDRGHEHRLSPWQRRGWLSEARSWLAAQVPDAGPWTVVKAGWNGSCVLRMDASSGAIYFKASAMRRPGEAAVIRTLAADWPQHVPELIAADASRNWMLMRELAARPLQVEDECDLEDAARAMARIQIGSAPRAARWLDAGCEDRGLGTLRGQLDALLVDVPRRLHAAGIISEPERDAIGAFVPAVRDRCDALAAFAIPSFTIHHEDFHPGNAWRADVGEMVFVDWNDTVLSHPFFTLQRFLWFFPADDAALRRTFCDAYLEPFELFERPARLRDAFELSTRLAPLYELYRVAMDAEFVDAVFARGLTAQERSSARSLMNAVLAACVLHE